MIKVQICVGSSCYLKGAQNVINHLEKIIREKKLESKVELAGAFCLGNCGEGIAVCFNDIIRHITCPEEAENLLNEYLIGE